MEEMVVEALIFGDAKSRVMAAKQVGQFTRKQRHKIPEKDIIPPLISMLHSQDYEAIEASLLALLNLAYGSERNKILIGRFGAISVIAMVLQLQNESLCGLAIAALLTLSSCMANKVEIVKSGAVEHLLYLLRSQFFTARNMIISLDIISVLHNLSTCHEIVPRIAVSGGGVALLLQIINSSEKSSEMVEKAAAVLENMVCSSDAAMKEAAETAGCVGVLVEAMEEGSRLCKEYAVGILLRLCRSCRESYRGVILREGAMAGLLQLTVDGTATAREKAKALILLLRDCPNRGGGGGQRNPQTQAKNVLLEEVMSQIDRGDRAGMSVAVLEEMIAKLRT
ncbi:PREDICTED: U-box domain-containing protein 3 [Ipomoea nil]|uniref:U-box domain-containing protein 3 n=1 Tax=Ipomoea nil TaxID=35883 RepID=UPI00090156BB|nr:PREDICTED: U-box domain-containing protein 3 [Ipomoea nil]